MRNDHLIPVEPHFDLRGISLEFHKFGIINLYFSYLSIIIEEQKFGGMNY